MGCGCGKKGVREYVVTTRAGRVETVDSLQAALNIVRAEGGRYVINKK